jgi:putative ABC transport system permease protein
VATPNVATPAVLGLYGLSAADLAPASDIISSRSDLGEVQLGSGFKGDFLPVIVQRSALLPNYTSAPNTLITPKAMKARGYTAEPVGWLVQAKHAVNAAEVTYARQLAAARGLTVETRTGPDDGLRRLRDYSTVAGILVALGVLAMTVGLIRSETAGDLHTLAAAGAGSTTRRTLNATSAGALAVLAALLGVGTAYLALIAWHWRDVSYLNKPPYLNLGILILGLPIVAAVGAWLLGRTPQSLGHRPLE